LGIFAALKTKELKIKRNISKILLVRLALFVAVIGVATLFDIFFESNSGRLEEMQTESTGNSGEQGKMYFVTQTNSIGAKTSAQKNAARKLQVKSHDKLIQKYHQLRNFQVLKAEVQSQTTLLISSYHYLAFKNYFFTNPDDEPLVS
jgi:hypothetical protein